MDEPFQFIGRSLRYSHSEGLQCILRLQCIREAPPHDFVRVGVCYQVQVAAAIHKVYIRDVAHPELVSMCRHEASDEVLVFMVAMVRVRCMTGLRALLHQLDRYQQEFDYIARQKRNYSPWQVAVGGGLACGGFCIQFGCDWTAFFYAALAAIMGLRLRMYLNEKGSNTYVNISIAAFVSTLLAWVCSLLSVYAQASSWLPSALVSSTPWHQLLACALFIVPGVPLINFVSDMLSGFTQVGMTRAVNTLMMLLAMAFGIAFAIQVCGIDNFAKDLPMTPHHNYHEYMLAAAISAIGFSMIFNTPHHLMWAVALGGIISVCTRNFVNLGPSSGNIGLDQGLVVGSFAGSAVVSIICCALVRQLHTPHQLLSIPSVIPMIPGVLMYRALFAFINMHGIEGEVTVAMNNAIQASLTILFIALGVAIPNVFFRRMITHSLR